MNEYLRQLEQLHIRPNFWCSEEYFEKAKFKTVQKKDIIWVEDNETSFVFPPIVKGQGLLQAQVPNKGIWADLKGYQPEKSISEFMDYEYIYNPKNFLDMKGKRWMIFRKNCRKFPKRFEGILKYSSDPKILSEENIKQTFMTWVKRLKDEEIHDGEVLIKYLVDGKNRKVLIDQNGNVQGINIWDYSYQFVNFRYCFCLNIPFLSEYMRWIFYVDMVSMNSFLVNDGGTLGRPDLKRFKDKMNPIEIKKVLSWKQK